MSQTLNKPFFVTFTDVCRDKLIFAPTKEDALLEAAKLLRCVHKVPTVLGNYAELLPYHSSLNPSEITRYLTHRVYDTLEEAKKRLRQLPGAIIKTKEEVKDMYLKGFIETKTRGEHYVPLLRYELGLEQLPKKG